MTETCRKCHGRRKTGWAVVLFAVFLAGCSSAPRQTFDLGGLSIVSTEGDMRNLQKKHIQLLITNPDALKALDGQDIVIRGGDGSIAYLKGAQWSDRLPSIVQARIVQVFEDTRLLGGVGRPGDGLAINYQIISDIRLFGIDLTANGRFAHVEIAVKIMDDKTGNIRRTHVFSARKPVTGVRNGDYARALDSAFSAVLADIVNWTFETL